MILIWTLSQKSPLPIQWNCFPCSQNAGCFEILERVLCIIRVAKSEKYSQNLFYSKNLHFWRAICFPIATAYFVYAWPQSSWIYFISAEKCAHHQKIIKPLKCNKIFANLTDIFQGMFSSFYVLFLTRNIILIQFYRTFMA